VEEHTEGGKSEVGQCSDNFGRKMFEEESAEEFEDEE
jgi:hypothetical protein